MASNFKLGRQDRAVRDEMVRERAVGIPEGEVSR